MSLKSTQFSEYWQPSKQFLPDLRASTPLQPATRMDKNEALMCMRGGRGKMCHAGPEIAESYQIGCISGLGPSKARLTIRAEAFPSMPPCTNFPFPHPLSIDKLNYSWLCCAPSGLELNPQIQHSFCVAPYATWFGSPEAANSLQRLFPLYFLEPSNPTSSRSCQRRLPNQH